MLSPKKTKFRKQQKGRIRGAAKGGSDVHFGEFGLQALTSGKVTARQIEAARIAMTRRENVRRFGYESFPTNPFPKSPPKFGWVRVRVASRRGWPWLSAVA